jgi:hypothetical protein
VGTRHRVALVCVPQTTFAVVCVPQTTKPLFVEHKRLKQLNYTAILPLFVSPFAVVCVPQTTKKLTKMQVADALE